MIIETLKDETAQKVLVFLDEKFDAYFGHEFYVDEYANKRKIRTFVNFCLEQLCDNDIILTYTTLLPAQEENRSWTIYFSFGYITDCSSGSIYSFKYNTKTRGFTNIS